MPDHIYMRDKLIQRLENSRGKRFEEIDNQGIFEKVKIHPLQKGIAGHVVERCIFGYTPDSKQEADLIIVDENGERKTELKVTGMVIDPKPAPHFIAKEPMSITAVGVSDIEFQTFYTSHFWDKLQYMLILYYHYDSKTAVSAYAYKDFKLVGYEFHEFNPEDVEVLKNDWQAVRDLCAGVTAQFDRSSPDFEEQVKVEYINVHGQLRRVLSYIDLAPKFPPRFRLKKSTVNALISNHFGYELEQLPGRYSTISDIDKKCSEITRQYKGKTVAEIGKELNISISSKDKAVTERIIIAMFGGTANSLRQIEIFQKFSLIAKTVVKSSKGTRTEDMKMFRCDFDNFVNVDFEESELYSYFSDNGFLCVVFEEPYSGCKLEENKFVCFKRLVFSEDFIDEVVRKLWDDTRDKIINKKLVNVVRRRADGSVIINKTGEVSAAPNWMKSKENDVFIRGSGTDSSMKYKTEVVNGIPMLQQWVWVRGKTVIEELDAITEI
jgi:hypothetical protein